ncbi:MAG: RnfABCDGE type electron transport complex subunit G [Coprobacter sp.]|nr:RnfABCDGE type electron transport complex subunit G [Coprobacter sp.]
MAKKASTFFNMTLVLTAVCIVAGVVLGAVHRLTEEPVMRAEKAKQEQAVQEVAPDFDNDPLAEQYVCTLYAGTKEEMTLTVFPARQNGVFVGAAVESLTRKGFGGEISVMVGFDADSTIRNYRVLKHAETPGLGSKMEEWFRSDKNRQSILGLHPDKENLNVSKDGGQIDAITAATISSRAFLDAIQNAYRAFIQNPETIKP